MKVNRALDCRCDITNSQYWFCRSQLASLVMIVGFLAYPIHSRNSLLGCSLGTEQAGFDLNHGLPSGHVILA